MRYFFIIILSSLLIVLHSQAQTIQLTSLQLQTIGDKIYHNETGSNPEYLIAWNEGEHFASLGIGHFIWFPENLDSRFTETFPDLIAYLGQQNVDLPVWLLKTTDCPWPNKQAFINAQNSPKMKELRALLSNTFEHQVAFIHKRMKRALPLILHHVNNDTHEINKQNITHVFSRLTQTELGMYALIDYVNFKGEGVSTTEKYKGQGWGLMQVLSEIKPVTENVNKAFSQACIKVLSRRVENSPQAEVEAKWLPGWKNRCNTYSN